MTLPLPVLRVGKIHSIGKSTPGSVMGHLARTRPTRNADSKRTADNQWLIGHAEMDLQREIGGYLDENGIKPRSNAVIACDLVLSVSHAFFTPAGDPEATTLDARKIRAFKNAALSFVKEKFGSRIVAAVLHLDEHTPHLQAVMVPLIISEEPEQKPRLCARDLFSRGNLVALQQAWEDALQPLGVGQRTKRSDLHHVDAKRYGGCIAAIKRADPTAEVEIQLPAPKRLESAYAYVARIQPSKIEEELRLQRRIEPLLGLALDGKLLRASLADRSKMSSQLRRVNKTQADVEARNKRLRLELEQYSPPPASAVAAAIGVSMSDDTISPIMAVMRYKRLNRNNALIFLVAKFGSQAVSNIVREEAVLRFREVDFDRAASLWQMPAIETDSTIPSLR